ncbi:MAG TPA: serine/threonine-protein kinase [Gemmatimonadales bacterium]|nr:serine/threonine-protein kinase [Gemmatimonadales bacterium]
MTLLERLRNAVAPRYTVDREIARGGMGIVFVGQDTRLTRTVAIKVLKPELATEEFSRRFLHEAQLMAKVRHPNVAVVHDSDERDGLSYFVMDFIEGETLAQRLESGALDSETVRRTGRDLLTALEAVHRHGIIHRDVKPANIFLTEHGALLSDFGIARSDQDETLTRPGRRVGTPSYWAPEQNEGEEVTRAADIYSAGAVLYQAWTGRRWPLYLDPAIADWSGVPPSAQPGLARALASLPRDRWQTAADFAASLKEPATGLRRGYVLAGVLVVLLALGMMMGDADPVEGSRPHVDLAIVPFDGGDSLSLGRAVARQVGFRLEWWPKWQSLATTEAFAWWDSVDVARRERDAARQLNSRFVVHGSLAPRAGDLMARIAVLDSNGRVFETADIPRQGRDRLAWSDAIADTVVRRLFSAQLEAYREVTSGAAWSREAVREMIAGDDAFHLDDWDTALQHYDRALAIDPGFAQAAWMRTVLLRWKRRPAEAELRRLYLTRQDALPELYRELAAAQLEPDLRLRFRRFDSIVGAFPRRWIARFIYADELFHRGPLIGIPLDSALHVMRLVGGGDPSTGPTTLYDHTGWGYIRLGRKSQADSAIRARARIAERVKAVGGSDRADLLRLAWYARFAPFRSALGQRFLLWTSDAAKIDRLGEYARLALAFDLPQLQLALGDALARPPRPDSLRATAHTARALALVVLGRGREALAALDTAGSLSGTRGIAFQRAEWRVMFPALGLPIADTAERAAGRRELLAAAGDQQYGARASWALAVDALASGDTAGASRWAMRLAADHSGSPEGRKLAAVLGAMRLASAGRRDSAIALTKNLSAVVDSVASTGGPFARAALHLSRGRWLAERGRAAAADSAWLWYEASDNLESVEGGPSQGEIDVALSVLARLLRSEVLVKLGAAAAACDHARRIEDLWAGADPAFAPLLHRAAAVRARCTA